MALMASVCLHMVASAFWAPMSEHLFERQFELSDLVGAPQTDRFATALVVLQAPIESEDEESTVPAAAPMEEEAPSAPAAPAPATLAPAVVEESSKDLAVTQPEPASSARPRSKTLQVAVAAAESPEGSVDTDEVSFSAEESIAVRGLGTTMGTRLGGRLRGVAAKVSWPQHAKRAAGSGSSKVARAALQEADLSELTERYKREVEPLFEDSKRYPRSARRAGLEGAAFVDVHIDAEGTILEVELAQSSGHTQLDRAALESARAVGKLPAPPAELKWATKTLRIPFRFSLT